LFQCSLLYAYVSLDSTSFYIVCIRHAYGEQAGFIIT
jgi:hypothetical protein